MLSRKYLYFLILIITSPLTFAGNKHLVLIDGNTQLEIPVSELRQIANTEFTLYAPFRRKEVQAKGILLEDFLQKYLSRTPKHLKFFAFDDYEFTFTDFKKKQWVIVTHENGKPLSTRNHGPLRLVEMDVIDKNVRNLREFNDWVWMLVKIEVLHD